jgi:hypothetical protein
MIFKILVGIDRIMLLQPIDRNGHRIGKQQSAFAARPNVRFDSQIFAMRRAAAFSDKFGRRQIANRTIYFYPMIAGVSFNFFALD